jgi:regulator of cell morphogenesis and NO signaling
MIDASAPVGSLAASNPHLRTVLEDLGIDYCCSEERTVQDVATAEGLTMMDLESAIGLVREDGREWPHEAWLVEPLSALIAHLEVGHATKAAAVSRISALAEMVSPFLSRQVAFGALLAAFHELIIELVPHTQREELVIFPYVLDMESAAMGRGPLPRRPDGGLRALVHPLSSEHRRIQHALSKMRAAWRDLHLSDHDEAGPRVLSEMRELTREVHEFMNLEMFVLFPRAVALEERLFAERAQRESPARSSEVTFAR